MDSKNNLKNGFDTLEELQKIILLVKYFLGANQFVWLDII